MDDEHLILKLVDLPLETVVDGSGEQHAETHGVMFMPCYGVAPVVRIFQKLPTFLIDEEGVVDVGHLAVLAIDDGQGFVAMPSEGVFNALVDEFRRVTVQEQLAHVIFPDDLIAHTLSFLGIFFPTKRTNSHKTAMAHRNAIQEGKPKAVGNTPNSKATPPTVKAYGI